jgi:hypothetical protein
MAKVIAITDTVGELLGVVRADPVKLDNGMTIQSVPLHTPGHQHHTLEVPDDLLSKLAKDVHHEVRRRLAEQKGPSKGPNPDRNLQKKTR